MEDEDQLADDLIAGSSKRSASYHADYGRKTCGEIKRLANRKPPDLKARQMKKLIEETHRLRGKARRPRH